MKLENTINEYITYRRSLGARFDANESVLHFFNRWVGRDIQMVKISPKMINEFLYGNAPVTSNWFVKHSVLNGLYKYAIARKYVERSPLPTELPKKPKPFMPYLYSHEEIKMLLEAALQIKTLYPNDPCTIRMILLMLYTTGIRPHEALALTNADVDTVQNVLIIRNTKNFKSRLVPYCSQLAEIIDDYIINRQVRGYTQEKSSPFFSLGNSDGFITIGRLQVIFRRIRASVAIKRPVDDRYQPRLMDFRHTCAVHHLTEWYRQGANVQQLLPLLVVYMGHTHLASTSIYLTCTAQLLYEAAQRFEGYINGGDTWR